ncbi:MAG: hypothetical protein K0U39_05290, partial [Alphaproteobacteria bacterium]|nr:hypothetical protein [Alphaproteobacteria bacterium]
CVQDDWPDENKDRSFYLDMMKLLVNEDTDWNAKNIYDYYHYDDDEDGSSTIADILKWVEKEMKADKSPYRDYDTSHCIEVVDYVKNYLKENNITIE